MDNPFGKEQFQPGTIFQMLVDAHSASHIVEEWAERNYEFDMRIRKAKTKGKRVIELSHVLFASYILRNYHAQVNIKYPIHK